MLCKIFRKGGGYNKFPEISFYEFLKKILNIFCKHIFCSFEKISSTSTLVTISVYILHCNCQDTVDIHIRSYQPLGSCQYIFPT